jgi:hypothetical protein
MKSYSSKFFNCYEIGKIPIVFFLGFILYDVYILLAVNALPLDEVSSYVFQGISLIYASFSVLYISFYNKNNKMLYFLAIVFVFAIFGLFLSQNLFSVVAFLKSYLLFILITFLSLHSIKILTKVQNYNRITVLFVTLVASVFLLVHTLYGFESWFFDFGYDYFYASRHISKVGQIPIGFVILDPFTGEYGNRPFGLFLSPDKMGYLIATCLITIFVGFAYKTNAKVFSFFLFLIAIITLMTHVKIVTLLMLVFAFSYLVFDKINFNNFYFKVFVISIPFGIGLVIAVNVLPMSYLSNSGAIQHLWGFVAPMTNSNPLEISFWFGNGIGNGGTIGRVGTDTSELSKADVGGESFIGSVFYQMGLIGLFLFFYGFSVLDRQYKNICTSRSYNLCSAFLVSILITSVMSEALLSFFQSCCLAIIMISLVKAHSRELK